MNLSFSFYEAKNHSFWDFFNLRLFSEKNCHFSPFFALFLHFFFHVYVVKLKVYYIKVFYKRDFIVQFLWSKKSLIWGLSMVFRMAKHKVYPASFTYLLLLIKGSEFSIIWTSCSTNQPSKPSKPWNHVPNTGLFWYMAWNPPTKHFILWSCQWNASAYVKFPKKPKRM